MYRILAAISLFLLLLTAGCEEVTPPDAALPQRQVYAIGADWCGPCVANRPTLEQLEAEGFSITHIDVTNDQALADSYGATSLPLYIVYDSDGVEVQRTGDIRTLIRILRAVNKFRSFLD